MSKSDIVARFGATVRGLRFRLGISQEELAGRADLHRTYIAGIEGGSRNVTLKSIDKLARALEVSMSTLLHQAGEIAERAPEQRERTSPRDLVDILLVEDNPDDVELTLRAFKKARFANRVEVVRDGVEALDYIFCRRRHTHRGSENQPQAILLDLNLPKMGGLEVLRRIKADKRARLIPVVILTTSQNDRDIAESRSLGAKTYIVKPVDFQRLSEATPHLNFDWALLRPAMTKKSQLQM